MHRNVLALVALLVEVAATAQSAPGANARVMTSEITHAQ
jgi:hypothetical protein